MHAHNLCKTWLFIVAIEDVLKAVPLEFNFATKLALRKRDFNWPSRFGTGFYWNLWAVFFYLASEQFHSISIYIYIYNSIYIYIYILYKYIKLKTY